MVLYTKNGIPLHRVGDDVFDLSGRHVARIQGRKAFGPNGRYVATLDDDRLVYRSVDSAEIASAFARSIGSPFAEARSYAAAIIGDEPTFE
jgi:hypothetical protein